VQLRTQSLLLQERKMSELIEQKISRADYDNLGNIINKQLEEMGFDTDMSQIYSLLQAIISELNIKQGW
jgi:hypothetical protein